MKKVEAVKDSFDSRVITLRGKTRSETTNKLLHGKQDENGEPAQSAPQKTGQEIHKYLANEINNGTRNGILGQMLEKIESEFSCEFIQAEVSISGYAVEEKTQAYWSGKMDAVAIRHNDVLEVFVVDWKTTHETDLANIAKWWKSANFKVPLYQCLVYRELLQAHLKRMNVKAKVGIILVPIHQSDLELSCPGLGVNFEGMDKMHLLDNLKDFQWHPALDEPIKPKVHTIKLPCKLFKESFDRAVDVDESTNFLKGDTRLKDILNENATVADLLQALNLSFLKVEGRVKEEETKAQKDDKTSGIEIAASTEETTNEETKRKSSSSHRETQGVTRTWPKITFKKNSKK